MTIRTACSSSLVALHEAVVAISRNDCESAIVGGANLIMTPGSTTSMTEQNVLSKDGSCKTFSAAANGYARGEAITAIYIKKLDDAVRAGDPIQAVIRGTATNHDGKTLGMTVPSADAQESLIRRAYEVAGIKDVWKTAYVECHGTGTPIGDPIESDAVGRVFGDKGVYIGSVKPNLGHTEGASGLVSVIKTVLALKYRTIPPNIKSVPLNPAIPFKETQLTVPTEPTTWPTDRLERASINSFGVGGTNAHVIIDSAARSGTSGAPAKETHESLLLLFSANTQKSLEKMVDNYRNFLEQDPNCIENLAYTLANRREHLPYRTFAIASRGNLGTIHPIAKAARPATVIMVFTGQGAQWPRMGRSLLDSNLTFLESIRRLDEYLRTLSDRQPAWSIEEVLRRSGDKTRFNSAEFSQPLCTAVQIALVDTLAYMGVHPSAVVGHSSGEIAAAYAAGVLTAKEAILCAVHRGTVANDQQRPGAMAAIGMGWADTTKYLSSNVIIACDNSPQSVTISGDAEEVEAVIADIHRSQPSILAKKLPVDKAYHSFHMKDVGKQYNQLLKDALGEKAPTIPFFSSVTGKRVESTLDPRYWQRNLESPVLFRAAVTSILGDPVSKDAVFLEVGPHSALAGPLRQNFVHHSSTTSYVSVMIRNQNCVESLLAASGKLFTLHVPMDMGKLVSKGFCLPNLPTYPWNHDESYWYESRLSKEHRKRKHPLHELLGSRTLESTDLEPSWRNLLHLDVAAWIRDHKIDDDIVFPFAAYVAMAGEAVRQISGINETVLLRHILVNTALVVAEGKPTELVTNLRRHRLTDTLDSQWWEFSISSYNGYTWTKHCTGESMAQEEDLGASQELPSLPRKVHARKWFDGLRHGGLDLGQAFRNLADISASTSIQQATAKIINNKPTEVQQYHLHPTVVDSALQLLGVASVRGEARKHRNRLPTGCDNIALSRSVSDLAVEATTGLSRGSLVGNIQGVADGLCVLSMSGLRLEAMENAIVDDVTSTLPTARLHWGPDITFMDSNQLFKPSEDYARYEESLESLTRFCLLCSQTVLTEIDPDNAHLHKFRGWIKAYHELVDGRSIQCIDDNGIRKQIDDIVNQLAGTPAYSAARTLQKVCNNIGTILSGQGLTWQALITDDTALELREFIYRYDRSSFIKTLAHTKPNLRILELGSRRGAPSADILESLTHADGRTLFSRYTLTIKGFISVSENQKKLPNLNYASLDIDQDPFEQGFEGHQYDLIIANNTLPSTDRTSTSLQYIKKLLHPRGILLTHQLYQSSKWINYIFGTDPNWWCGITNESNHGGHFHGSNLYDELVSAGFNVSNTMLPDSQNPVQSNAIITASPVITEETTRRISLLHRDGTRDLGPIMRELELQGYDVVTCTIHDCPPSGRDVVVLLDRDGPFFENIDSQSFDSFKRFVHNLNDAGILWISQLSQMRCQDPRYAQVIGIARTMRSEMLLDFATCEVDDIDGAAHQLIQVLMKSQGRDSDDSLRPDYEYSIVNGVIHVGRFYPYTLSDEAPSAGMNNRAALNVDSAGRLSTLHWALQPVVPSLQPDEVEVEMYSVGLNFRVQLCCCDNV